MEEIKKMKFALACKMLKLEAKKVIPDFAFLPKKEAKAMKGILICTIMAKAANMIANGGKEWKPKYGSDTPWKYEIWWRRDGGSRGFRFYGYGAWAAISSVGSRLCFINREVGIALGRDNKEYIKAWNDWAVIN